MICNVVDRRSNKYDVRVDVVLEPSQHDNVVKGATQFTWGTKEFSYDEMLNTTIVQAIEYANEKYVCPTTLFLYDVGVMNRDNLR